jgi:hypothetical protein
MDFSDHVKNNAVLKESIRAIEQKAPNHIHLLDERMIDKNFLSEHSLMVVSLLSWKKLMDSKSLWLSEIPSTLILTNF